jgi:hypothetical protein
MRNFVLRKMAVAEFGNSEYEQAGELPKLAKKYRWVLS